MSAHPHRTMRAFVAITPPEPAVEDLDGWLEPRRGSGAFRWTLPEQLHVTLAFTEDLPERSLDAAVEGLAAAAGRRTPFAARVAGGGAFPHPDRGKVLWAGLSLDEAARAELDLLSAGCRTALARSGAEVDGARFRPHLTLARTGRPQQLTNWVRLLDAYGGPTFTVDEVHLVASHLGEGPSRRPRHEVLATLPLG